MRARLLVSFIALTCAPGVAAASDLMFDNKPVATTDDWVVTVEGTVGAQPKWTGSDEFGFFGYPAISIRKSSTPEHWSAPDDGISIGIYENQNIRLGPVARFDTGRYYGDDRRLFGLNDVKWSLEPGVFLEYWPTSYLRTRAEVRHGINGHDGFVGNVAADIVAPVGAFTFSVGPRLAWGDSEYTRTAFGVTPTEAALNGVVGAYRPGGGITSVGALATASYKWSPALKTTVFGGYDRLTSDAGDSPVVRAFGSRDQYKFGVSAAYSFHTKPWW